LRGGSTIKLELENDMLTCHLYSDTPVLVDVLEQLAWLGAACSESPTSNGVCYKKAVLVEQQAFAAADVPIYKIGYTANEVAVHAQCWLQMFRNSAIACEFPSQIREDRWKGLELSGDLMLLLANTSWALVYCGKFMLKSFTSALYPVDVDLENLHVAWHFLCQLDRTYLSYNAAARGCAGQELLADHDMRWLKTSRHFVGWAPKSCSVLGNLCTDRHLDARRLTR
jgi:hypothetical protein